MHFNLSLTPSQIPVARKPELGVESKVYFAPERGVLLGTVLATAAALAEYSSAGGLGIPTGGRDLCVRVDSANLVGTGTAVAQVETATAAGTVTTGGNATVTVTSALVTGSPLAVSVPVTLNDTAAQWAAKVRAALADNAAIAAHFTVGGTTTAIILTAIVAAANDATLNIAIANGTCAGITNAATSAHTTTGTSGAMTVQFNVVLADATLDTATATFHIPSYTTSQANAFPIGVSSDLIPDTPANADKKIRSLVSLAAVANMNPSNRFQVWATPNNESFVFIESTRGKGGQFNLPGLVQVPDGYNPSAFVKLGRGESHNLTIEFMDRGSLEQLNRFNGHEGTIRFDIVKDDSVLSQRILYYVRATSERGDGNTEVVAKS